MRKRAAFITIGQSPRDDILDEMRPAWSGALEVVQHGGLDGLDRAGIEGLAPKPGERKLVSRLDDGSEVTLAETRTHARVTELVQGLDAKGYDFLVLLCTGRFDELSSDTPLVKAQEIVDHGVAALSDGARVGVLVPHEEQTEGLGRESWLTSYASPYEGDRFEQAARALSGADLIVLHCMGYTRAHKARISEQTKKPVLLAREMVASAVAWLVD